MVATAVLMILLPNGSPRYLYPLIVVPCLLLGRALTVADGSEQPGLACVRLAPVQPPAVDDCFTRRSGRAVLWPRRSGASLLDLPGGSSSGRDLVIRRREQHRVSSLLPAQSRRLAAQAILSGSITALAVMIFATLIMPRIDSANRHRSREVAAAIRAMMPAGARSFGSRKIATGHFGIIWSRTSDIFITRWNCRPRQTISCCRLQRRRDFLQDPIWQNAPPTWVRQVIDNEKRAFDLFMRNANLQIRRDRLNALGFRKARTEDTEGHTGGKGTSA